MAYIGSQTLGNLIEHEEIIAKTENVGVGSDNLLFSIDTTNIVNIDILEFRYRPDPAEVVAGLDILELRWNNNNHKNNSGESFIHVYPSRESDGSYRYEPNHPPNLYFAEKTLHSHIPKKFSLSIIKTSNGVRLNTTNILLRFKVTKFMATQVELVEKFKSAILNQ